MSVDKLTKQLKEKYDSIDQDLETHLEGLLHSNPLNYWDYIQTEALLNLQIQRTTLPDEMVFIMYHQINELIFKMVLWEIDQVAQVEDLTASFFSEKLRRISRYFDMLTSSFNIMRDGLEVEQYRKIEFASTELINLIDKKFRDTIDRNTSFEHALEHLYWQAAGKDYKTGKKSYLLEAFEEKYKEEFIRFTKYYNTRNLWTRSEGR